eukprot:11622602-Ditylum_brightwellii.AAC.1
MFTAATSKTETKQKKAPQKEHRANTGSKGEEWMMEVHVISHAEPNTCAQSAAKKKENFCEKQAYKGAKCKSANPHELKEPRQTP